MKTLLQLFLLLALTVVTHARASANWYLRISHAGPEDGHLNALLITADPKNLAKTSPRWFDTVISVSNTQFADMIELIATEQKANGWPPSDGTVANEVGTFDISDHNNLDDSPRSFAWRLSRKQAAATFHKLAMLAEKTKLSGKLLDELRLRISIADQSAK